MKKSMLNIPKNKVLYVFFKIEGSVVKIIKILYNYCGSKIIPAAVINRNLDVRFYEGWILIMIIMFHTLGCKVNQYETQVMRAAAENAGYITADFAADGCTPDAVVINSCTVTGESDRKLRSLLRRIRRAFPPVILVLTGCMPQAFPETAAGFSDVDIILGNAARRGVIESIEQYLLLRERIVHIPEHGKEFEPMAIDRFEGRTRAFVKIEDGCNRFCSYCIIPYARGRVRSKPAEDIRTEISLLAQRGYCEVVLAGINLTAYGQEWGISLCDAVDIACGIDGINRVRLGSLEPDMLDEAAIKRFAAQPKLCPQFHLSLQSGCADTLARMNRRYTPAEYESVCSILRRYFPECALTTDVMVGFPGETDGEFEQSVEFVRRIGFSRVHVFAYSLRPGTPAAAAPDQISAGKKTERSKRMIAGCDIMRDSYLDTLIGKNAEVLVETYDGTYVQGHTAQYVPVRIKFPDGERLCGHTLEVRITEHSDGVMTAHELTI